MGRERALARPFLDTHEKVVDALAHVEEARRLLQEQVSLPFGGLLDVRDALGRAEKRAVLEPRELLAIAQILFAFEQTRDAFEDREETFPRLTSLSRRLPLLETLARKVDRCFEPDGTISDRASPALKEARDRTRGLHRHIKSRLDGMLHDEKFTLHLRESYYSLRNGRYVVPVLSQARNDVPGIVHNASQSGQTLFVEPEDLVGMGNDLAIAQAMVDEEERRVLQELTEAVGRESGRILEGVEALADLDEAEAAAVLAADLDAHVPDVSQDATVELRLLRHPRLVLKGSEVVPNDVRLSNESRALVISGPNAGGKTVTMTAVGLCALMLRAGLPIPAASGSRLPLYSAVQSAVGDAQDLEQGLSTFSAHVVQLKNIAVGAGQGSLALIDEIAADTDPREGAAIAIALLEDLLDKGSTVLVTTHLEELKALAHMDPRFINGRVGFDSKRMAPTYKLQLGASGSSSAIDVAARMGLSEHIIGRARELSLGAGGPLAQALAAAEEERRRLFEEREKVERAAREAEERAEKLAREQEAFDRKRKEAQVKFFEDVKSATQGAMEEVQRLLTSLRAQSSEKVAAQARAELQTRVEDIQKRTAALRAELAVG
ncbi:MAG: endonuclease MutS2, partial [Myxococcaceae bacterium]|nr:endonuclease MutS2 [Myxococcaceae bacterium]